MPSPDTSTPHVVRQVAAWVGLLGGLALVWWAFWYPGASGTEVYSRAPRNASDDAVPPLHGLWRPVWFGPGTLPALLLALLSWRYAAAVAERLPWRRLLLASYAAGLAWMLALALVDGERGLSRQLGNPWEYLEAARAVTDVGALLDGWVARMPMGSPDAFVTHVAGHPPAALLFFVGLVRVGLGGDLAAGVVVTLLAATTALGVMVTLRALGQEAVARRAAPFLVLAPSAVFMAVSFDAVIAATAAWGLACLALGATAATRRRAVAWSVAAGLLLGTLVMLSYGMPLMGLVALAVLAGARPGRQTAGRGERRSRRVVARRRSADIPGVSRASATQRTRVSGVAQQAMGLPTRPGSWLPLPVTAAVALLVVLGFAVAGWAWWEVYPHLVERYYEGIAKDRPIEYWRWANLALVLVSAGPLLAAGLVHAVALVRDRAAYRVPLLLVAGAVGCVAAATWSEMSKAEVERIWLPFMPWLLVSCALLPAGWRRWGLGLQLATALVVQHLFYTTW